MSTPDGRIAGHRRCPAGQKIGSNGGRVGRVGFGCVVVGAAVVGAAVVGAAVVGAGFVVVGAAVVGAVVGAAVVGAGLVVVGAAVVGAGLVVVGAGLVVVGSGLVVVGLVLVVVGGELALAGAGVAVTTDGEVPGETVGAARMPKRLEGRARRVVVTVGCGPAEPVAAVPEVADAPFTSVGRCGRVPGVVELVVARCGRVVVAPNPAWIEGVEAGCEA